jgi:antitoxin component of MazEF toxin-antitoxin module
MLARRQLVKNGNSTQCTIPRRMLDALRWRTGDPVLVELTERGTIEIQREVIRGPQPTKLQPMTLDASIPESLR